MSYPRIPRKHFTSPTAGVVCLVGTLAALLIASAAFGAWTTVGDGIEYQQFLADGPNNVFVCRMARSNTNATLETTIANGTVSGARETVRNQAARYDDALSWWGQSWGGRNKVVCAVNGDFFNGTTGVITGGQCHSGWYAKRFGNWGGYSGFGWTVNRAPFVGGCVYHRPQDQIVYHAATGVTQQFDDINVARGSGQMVIYTPQYSSQTPSASTGVEVLVEVVRPMVIILSPNKVIGRVRAIWQNSGSHQIPFDHVVISADGTKAQTLLSNVSVGSEVWISQFPTDYNQPDTSGDGGCVRSTGLDWQKTFAAVGINYKFLEDGSVRPPDPAHSGYAGLVIRNPRTAVAYNSTYIYFIVCDGRNPGVSEGMTMSELGAFCINFLGATEGANMDGGGSSTMVVNGVVKNRPSDGSERAVANGIMMINVLPKQQTATYSAGQNVRTTTTTNVRLGPGTNYAVIYTAPTNTTGSVVGHSLNGVLTKGYNWWKVSFPTATGWVAESLLASASPSVTSHPSPQTVCPGGVAMFSVTASGSTPLSYRWQKGTTDLTDGGHYSNAATPTLTVSGADLSDEGDYRCVVTNSYGSATSNAASLTLDQTPPSVVTVSDEGVWTPSLDTLKATWTTSTPGCGYIARYDYAIGTSRTSQDVKSWTSAGAFTSVTDPALSLTEGQTYYVQVRAVDSNGRIGPPGASDGITVAPEVEPISAAWPLADGASLAIRNKAVTAALSGAFWLEEQDRSAAIKVVSGAAVTPGNTVSVAGVLGMSGTQRALIGDVVHNSGGSEPIPGALGMSLSGLGGASANAYTPGVTGGISAYNIGLLVRCWGRVTHSDSSSPSDKFFYIDDGTGLSDGSYPGVKVRCGDSNPPTGGVVVVTGIVTSDQAGAKVAPVILATDVRALL